MNKLFAILIAISSLDANACSFARMTEPFEIIEGDSFVPETPNFVVEDIKRGFNDGNRSSCSDAGIITLKLNDVPDDPTGYLFEISEGSFEDTIFNSDPIKATKRFANKGLYKFLWFDGHSDEQESINITIKINAMSKTGNKSNPQYINVFHPGVKKPWWKLW